MDTGLVPQTRAWARAPASAETMDDAMQFYYDPPRSSWTAASRGTPLELRELVETDLPKTDPPPPGTG